MEKKGMISKIIHFPLVKIIAGLTVVAGVYALVQYVVLTLLDYYDLSPDIKDLIAGLVATVFAVFSYIFLFKFYEKRAIVEFSKRGLLKNLIYGFALGAILQSLTILVIYIKGGFSIISVNPLSYLIVPFTMAFTSAVVEETLVRGIIFRILEEKLGSYIALALSAVLFGMMHLANPHSSILTGLGLAVQAGLLLGAAYIYSRSLWFPIGIHFAWNFTQSAVFGANVSGNVITKTLITSEITGSPWFTGGDFGPEGSIQATIFCLVAAIILLVRSSKKG